MSLRKEGGAAELLEVEAHGALFDSFFDLFLVVEGFGATGKGMRRIAERVVPGSSARPSGRIMLVIRAFKIKFHTSLVCSMTQQVTWVLCRNVVAAVVTFVTRSLAQPRCVVVEGETDAVQNGAFPRTHVATNQKSRGRGQKAFIETNFRFFNRSYIFDF